MKIGVISDTHIPKRAKSLPDILLEHLKDVDHIIHAGDITDINVIKDLEKIAPVTSVAGNTDSKDIGLEYSRLLYAGEYTIGICHGNGKGKTINNAISTFKDKNVHCIVYGHSHIPFCEYINGILLFNPGSPTDKRTNKYYSFGILDINESIKPSIIYFSKENKIN